MRILLCVPSLTPGYGGPAAVVPAIGSRLKNCGVEVSYLSVDTANGARRNLTCAVEQGAYDLIANFGVWTPFNHSVARHAIRSDLPLVSCPMGMLEPWPMRQKRLKKFLAWHTYQKRDLQGCSVLHATAASEAANLTALGIRAPIVVIPHAVDLPEKRELTRLRGRVIECGPRTALFLSRIHPKKGLAELVESWARIKPIGWRLIIAGPDSDGYSVAVADLIRRSGAEAVEMRGPVHGDAKSVLFASADLFLLPSHSENFGLVVPEALAHEVPVLTTTGTPWSELPQFDCGWWIAPGVEPLVTALRKVLTVDANELRAMGKKGRRLVEDRYSWSSIVAQHLELYSWAAFGAGKPAFFAM